MVIIVNGDGEVWLSVDEWGGWQLLMGAVELSMMLNGSDVMVGGTEDTNVKTLSHN